jgi:hypothetical protein
METEFLLLKDILFLSALKYPINSNYINYNLESISAEINMCNRKNSVTDFGKLKSDQNRNGHSNLF